MEYLAMEVRRLMYTVICFQCLIQLTEGSAYQKYLKVFSYLLTMCICCNVIFSFAGQVENEFSEADQLYERWEKEWREMTASDRIDEGETYYKKLWEDEIIGVRTRSMTEGMGMEVAKMFNRIQEGLQALISSSKGGRKRPTKETMLILFLSGILIYVILLPTGNNNTSSSSSSPSNKKQRAENTDTAATEYTTANGENMGGMDTYRKELEKELEDFLSSVAGVGEVKVLIYMKNSQEYIVEKDVPVTNATNGENSEMRKEESTVYTVNESGSEVPFIAQTVRPSIDGVVISAKGAADENIRLQIVRLVMALYGVEANKIEVLLME